MRVTFATALAALCGKIVTKSKIGESRQVREIASDSLHQVNGDRLAGFLVGAQGRKKSAAKAASRGRT
jgi:hypothetical protein